MPKPEKRLPGGSRKLPAAVRGFQKGIRSLFKALNLPKSSEMRSRRKFYLPEGVPTTKAKKMLSTAVSTKGNRASWHRCQNLRKGFPEAPGSSQWLPEASRKVPEAYLKHKMCQNRMKCETASRNCKQGGKSPSADPA